MEISVGGAVRTVEGPKVKRESGRVNCMMPGLIGVQWANTVFLLNEVICV